MRLSKLIVLPIALLASITAARADFAQSDLEKMVKELEAYAPKNPEYVYPIKCKLVESDDINAHATLEEAEKGKLQSVMVVYTGLVKHVKGDVNMIRAVVAHEVSHLSLGHCTAPLWKAKDLSQFWTRQQETEADQMGASMLVRAGYKRDDMVEMLKMLDKLSNNWTRKIWSDHASPLQRAMKVADDPSIYESLQQFDVARAFWDNRDFKRASELFDAVYAKEPRLFSAVINSAATSLMYYYDHLPIATLEKWYRPDFGPLLAPNSIGINKDPEIRDEDRQRFKEAMAKIEKAMSVAGDQPKIQEIQAIAQILNPDNDTAMMQKGVDWIKDRLTKIEKDDVTRKLRFNNNIAVALQRMGKQSEATDTLTQVVTETGKVSFAVGENLSRDARVDKEGGLGANIMAYWLGAASNKSPFYSKIKARYAEFCTKLSLKPEEIDENLDSYLPVLSMVIDGTQVGLYDKFADLAKIAGKPDKAVYFDDKYKGLLEVNWKNGDVQAFVEDEYILRITSRLADSFVELRSSDPAVRGSAKVTVGMSEADLNAILPEDESEKMELSKLGKAEEWRYYGAYYLGVLVQDGKVTAITFTPVAQD